MPGLRSENHRARNVMGAVTGLPGVRQRAEGISAATRLASDQAVILAYVVPSVGSSAVVIVPDARDDFFRPGGPSQPRRYQVIKFSSSRKRAPGLRNGPLPVPS